MKKIGFITSPNEWYAKILAEKGKLPSVTESKLNGSVSDMKKIITTINNIRFDLDEQIRTLDLTKRENLSLVYDKLEEGVKLYKEFYTKQRILETHVEAYYKTLKFTADEMQFPEVLVAMQNVYSSFRTGLNALYFKDDDNFGELIRNQEDALAKLNNVKLADYNSTSLINSKVQTYWGNIRKQFSEAIIAQKAFAESENIPDEFKLYDKYCYYYNICTYVGGHPGSMRRSTRRVAGPSARAHADRVPDGVPISPGDVDRGDRLRVGNQLEPDDDRAGLVRGRHGRRGR